MADATVLLSFARILTAVLAGTIAALALRAYLRTRRPNILALSAGAGLLGAGYLTEGLLVEVAGWTIVDATVFESIVTLAAAATLVASLYLKDRRTPPRPGPVVEVSP